MKRHTDTRRSASRMRRIAALATGGLLATGLLAPAYTDRADAATHRHVETFTSTSGTTWVVPAGVDEIRISLAGGRGGSMIWGGQPGLGDVVTFDVPATSGDRFTFYGATDGNDRNGGKGWVNGGKGGDRSGSGKVGAGGGGAAAVKRNGELIAVAGGGGGGGGWSWIQGKTVGGENLQGGAGGNAGQSGKAGQAHSGTHPGNGGAGAARSFGNGGGNASSAATFSEGAGGGGGGGGYASGNGGSSGKKYNGHGAGGGGGGGSSWTAPGITPTIQTNEDWDGYVKVSWEAPVELTTRVLNPTIQAGAPVYVHVSAVEPGTTTDIYGQFRLVEDGTTLRTWIGYSQVVELNLTPGAHTITVSHFEFGGTTTARELEIVVPEPMLQSGLGELEAVAIDLDVVPTSVPHNETVTIGGQIIAAQGGLPANIPVFAVWNGTHQQVLTAADGRFSFTLPAAGSAGTYELTLSTYATSLFEAAPSLVLPVNVVGAVSSATLTASPTTLVYGQPLSATVSVVSPGSTTPTGLVVLADQEDLVAVAALDANGQAQFTNVFVHPGTTQLRALYAGDETHADDVSDPVALTVSDASTTTTLAASSLSGHAGDLTAIRVTVQAQSGSVLEPAGSIELLVNGDVFDTASIGSDADLTPHDGVVAFDFDTTDLPAGDLTLQARFVPGPGYQASQSDAVDLTLDAHDVHLFVSPSSIEVVEGTTAIVAGHVEVLGHEDGGLMRVTSSAPAPEGSLVAFLGDDVIAVAHTDPDSGSAELEIDGLPVGSGSLRIAFIPDSSALASAQQEIAYTVTSAPTPAPGGSGSEPLAETGASGSEGLVATAAALIALLGTALLVVSRRRAAVQQMVRR